MNSIADFSITAAKPHAIPTNRESTIIPSRSDMLFIKRLNAPKGLKACLFSIEKILSTNVTNKSRPAIMKAGFYVLSGQASAPSSSVEY